MLGYLTAINDTLKKHCYSIFTVVLLLYLVPSANAQTQFSGWLASFNTFKINDRFSIHFDAQVRSTDKLEQVRTIILRPGLNVKLTDKLTASVGYAYIANRTTVIGISELLTEHRIWQQALYAKKIKNLVLLHRLRFEERFLPQPKVVGSSLKTDDYTTVFRLRYFIRSMVPLVKQRSFTKGFFMAVQNEVFLNTGNKTAVNGKTFDQNRLYAAIGYRLVNKIDVEAGYMNQYTVTRSSFTNNHIVQIAVYKRL